MKIKTLLSTFILSVILSATVLGATYYVSSSGSNSNTGVIASSPLASITEAYKKDSKDKTIILLDNVTYSDAASAYSCNVTIKGNSSGVTLSLPSTVNLKGNLKLENVTLSGASVIYANGYNLEIAESVTCASTSNRLTVYGGTNGSSYTGNTYITLYGGHYSNIFGGSNGASLTGNTNVTVGGNVNSGDGIDDDASNISPCYVYGGGNNGSVSGKTNVTLTGNAVTKYLVGAGKNTGGLATDTNIFIKGGKVMNVYGGSHNAPLNNCNTHIIMTGGLAEAIFGGCENTSMTGNTFVTLLSGDVSRRVYTGCYNNVGRSGLSASWSSEYYVTGTTTLVIGPDMLLNTTNGLSSDNQNNMGVFSGSRIKSGKNTGEYNTIIYLDGCYSNQKSKIGEQSLAGMFLGLKSSEKYTVNAALGGIVEGTTTAGVVKVTPADNRYALVGSAKSAGGNVSISTGTTAITFPEDFALGNILASSGENGIVTASLSITAENMYGAKNPTVYCSLYEGSKLVEITIFPAVTESTTITFTTPVSGDYYVKAFILDETSAPVCQSKKS